MKTEVSKKRNRISVQLTDEVAALWQKIPPGMNRSWVVNVALRKHLEKGNGKSR